MHPARPEKKSKKHNKSAGSQGNFLQHPPQWQDSATACVCVCVWSFAAHMGCVGTAAIRFFHLSTPRVLPPETVRSPPSVSPTCYKSHSWVPYSSNRPLTLTPILTPLVLLHPGITTFCPHGSLCFARSFFSTSRSRLGPICSHTPRCGRVV